MSEYRGHDVGHAVKSRRVAEVEGGVHLKGLAENHDRVHVRVQKSLRFVTLRNRKDQNAPLFTH